MKFIPLALQVTSIALAAGFMTLDELAVDFKMIDDSGQIVSPDQSGKKVFELVNANQSSSLGSSILTVPTQDISVLSSAMQLLVNTTDGQDQDLPTLLKGPLTALNAVAGVLPGTASQELLKRSLDERNSEKPTKTRPNKGRKSARPTRAVNITLNLGNGTRNGTSNGAHGSGEMLHQGALLTWIFTGLLVFAAI
ncbi:hypothetical protein N0V95_009178 [Ascochyta clinopodiicola]|nr:hypothetical protein N0V95_009178 [Ascochyta clinopodiicola]